jgi:hypothetical protein
VAVAFARYYGGPFAALQPDQYRTLLWDLSDCDLPMGSYDALFIHSKRRTLLASGYARVDEEDSSVVLSDWLPCEHPPLASAADLTILLCETGHYECTGPASLQKLLMGTPSHALGMLRARAPPLGFPCALFIAARQ